ncbi:MAG: hypothetical protein Q4F66_00075 [Clostridium sp.]|nr:hypothetical protein [Clostridium sp.]
MKIKKALALVVSAALSISTLTGCSQATQNYGEELNKISEWGAYTTEGTGTYTISGQGISTTLNYSTISYYSDNKTYSEIKYDDPEGPIKMPDMKVYGDGLVSYINKSYFEDMYTMNGQTVPEGLKNLNAEYIALDSGFDTDKMKAVTSNPKDYADLAKNLLGDSNIDLPYVQNGREYELNLDSEKIAELESLLLKNLAPKNSDENGQTGLTNEEQQKSADELKELYTGSSMTTKESFEDDKYTLSLNYDIKAKDSSEVIMTMNSISNKCDKKDIVIPTSVVKLTQEELTKLLVEEDASSNSSALAKTIEETVE